MKIKKAVASPVDPAGYCTFNNLFNFRHLPFKQARFLPILLYKPRLGTECSGNFVAFKCPVRFGLVKLGKNCVSIYPDSGISNRKPRNHNIQWQIDNWKCFSNFSRS